MKCFIKDQKKAEKKVKAKANEEPIASTSGSSNSNSDSSPEKPSSSSMEVPANYRPVAHSTPNLPLNGYAFGHLVTIQNSLLTLEPKTGENNFLPNAEDKNLVAKLELS